MKRKTGIFADLSSDPGQPALHMIKDAGFETIASDNYDVETVCKLKNECDKIGLELTFLHAPYYVTKPFYIHTNEFWRGDLTYIPLYEATISTIDAAAESGVGTMMMHVSGGWDAPPVTDIGLSHFDRVVEYAMKRGVRIGFENLRNVGNLAAILERYERVSNVGFCYDCGHEHCYTQGVRFLDLFGKKTFCTHMHDNWGLDKVDPTKDADYHLLPFDGEIDYQEIIDLMDKYGYAGPLTQEVGWGGRYRESMTQEEFYRTSHERMERIANMTKEP